MTQQTSDSGDARSLHDNNEVLRRQVAELQSERIRLEEERIDLREQVLALELELKGLREKESTLRERIDEAERETQEFSARYVEVEEQNNKLANLYVASYRLHETANRDDVLIALQEIVINLIGSEDFLILENDRSSGRLSVAVSFGVEADRIGSLNLEAGPIARAAHEGELYLAEGDAANDASNLLACIPLGVGNVIYGVIAIFKLLDHKRDLEALDHELFDLLASHAATALSIDRGPSPDELGTAASG